MSVPRKSSSQADSAVLEELHEIAAQGGGAGFTRCAAMREYLAHKRQQSPRRIVLDAFQESVNERESALHRP